MNNKTMAQVRASKGISCAEAANKIGLSPNYLRKVECGLRRFGTGVNANAARQIYGELAKFRQKCGSPKFRHCIVCNLLFSGCGQCDERGASPTYRKRIDVCSRDCRNKWYKGDLFKAPLLPNLMDAPPVKKERRPNPERLAIEAIIKEARK